MNPLNIEKISELMREAGAFQLKHFRSVDATVVDMKAARETVSFVDVETESMLYDGLNDILPEAGFFGEETGKSGNQNLMWVVDPLDGTTNFLSGSDHFSISVSLVSDGMPVFGAVYRPYTGEIISAELGKGVRLNDQVVAVQFPDVTVKDALFVTGFPYRSEDISDAFFRAAPRILRLGRGIRRTGSAALDLAHLGCGFYQGFWESDLQPYDVAAALVMMSENNLVVTNHRGEPYNMFKDRILVAGFRGVHEPLLEVVRDCYETDL